MERTKKTTGAGDLKARVLKLEELAGYQPESIVSREIISRKSGTVTLFAFDASQQLSEHTAPFDALAVGLDGEAEIFIAGEPNRVAKGDMIIMPANVPHSLKAAGRFKMMLIMIKK